MIKKTDPLCNCLRPLLDKTLENALAYRIKKEFPRIGGPRIRTLCAEMVLEVVHRHIRAKDCVKHGQILWTAVSRDHPPARRQRMTETELVTVILDLSTPEDLQARMQRVPEKQRKLRKAIRLCRQAYEQGGVLSNVDLSEILSIADARVGQLLGEYERQTGQIVPRRATIHDVGTGLSHTNGLSVINDTWKGKAPTRSPVKRITVWMRWIAIWVSLIGCVTAVGRDSALRRQRIS